MGRMLNEADNRITYFAQTNFRNERKAFGIKKPDRRAHMYLIGKTGTGKSTLLETLIRQDIENGEGLALLDPHGDLVEKVLRTVPEKRKSDLIYFNVPDRTNPLAFNPLENVPPEKRPLAAAGLLDAFKKIWAESWGPAPDHDLRQGSSSRPAILEVTNGNVELLAKLAHCRYGNTGALKSTSRRLIT
jgi:hypothetical protein